MTVQSRKGKQIVEYMGTCIADLMKKYKVRFLINRREVRKSFIIKTPPLSFIKYGLKAESIIKGSISPPSDGASVARLSYASVTEA